MREIVNRESTLPPLDRLVAARGNRRQGIWTSLAPPFLHGPATWLRPGLPIRTALSKEVPPVLPRAEHTQVVLVRTPETDSLPKMPNRPLVSILQRSEDPAPPSRKTAQPLKPHHRGPPLQGCVKSTPVGCRGPDRIETPQTVADCGGCGVPWARRTSRGATMRSASWATGIPLRKCACDCSLSANHFCKCSVADGALEPPLVPHLSTPWHPPCPSPPA